MDQRFDFCFEWVSVGMSTVEARTTGRRPPHMPSDVTPDLSFFDQFATRASGFVSRAWFFAACILLVLLWAPSILVIGSIDTWQLIINTATTIVTFLLVALLQNTQTRNDEATQDKLNALAEAMATLMAQLADVHARGQLRDAVTELRDAVGIEDKESS
jgi:low affinity Fe/Cu permease